MHIDELEEALRQSSEDRRVSRGERRTLRDLIAEHDIDEHAARLLRSRAFRIAQEALDAPRAKELLAWLEDVVGLLAHHTAGPAHIGDETAAWFSPGEDCLGAIVKELIRVRRSADICVFTITDNRITDGILSAARRGVRVRVISDDEKSGDTGSDLGLLGREGIPVAFDGTSGHMHHKFALFDRARLLTGSFNWTRSASSGNQENLLRTDHLKLVDAFGREFDRLWAAYTE